jgi:hypothetical protein
MKNKIVLFLVTITVIFFFKGCASKVPPPLKDISNAKIALANAKEANAEKLAPKTFYKAQKFYKQIAVFMKNKAYKEAKYSAEKSYIQAKLAYKKAQNLKIQKKIDQLNGEVNRIKNEFTTISK